jgi:serine palmitoyltransferase
MELERDIAAFLRVQSAIIYSQGFSTVSSVIPSFCKRGDIIVADRGCNFSIQKGLQISRSTIKWYEHNNVDDLERVLEELQRDDKRSKRKLTRRFIVTEALFENDGSIVDLPRIVSYPHLITSFIRSRVDQPARLKMELKRKFKYRLILDESWSFGVLGRTGRGVTEFYDIKVRRYRPRPSSANTRSIGDSHVLLSKDFRG